MAQLVKLQDYISRYEIDLTRYPTQFIRLKKGQWERVRENWERGDEIPQTWEHFEAEEETEKPKFRLLKKFFKSKKTLEEPLEEDIESVDTSSELDDAGYMPDQEAMLHFEANIVYKPQTIYELKRMFMDQFFHFQVKWASSTVREKSYVDPKYMRDTLLRSFLQTLPDNYLVFYYPILKLKKAPIELDIVVMTPTECICITVLEHEEQAVYIGSADRFWTKKVGKYDKKVLNPLIQLNRMETILMQLFAQDEIDMPIRKVLLSRNGYIDYPGNLYGTHFIDKRKYAAWHEQFKRSSSPLKHMQIRAAQSILNYVQTTSFSRDIWTADEQDEKEEN